MIFGHRTGWVCLWALVILGVAGCNKPKSNNPEPVRPITVESVRQRQKAADAAARAPIPEPPANPRTDQDFLKTRALWFDRMTLGGYRTAGRHNPAWDAMADQFLQNCCADTRGEAGAASSEVLADQSAALAAAGCDDAIVLRWQGLVVANAGNNDEAIVVTRRALDQLKTAAYPKIYTFFTARNLVQMLHRIAETDPAELDRFRQLTLTGMAEAIVAGEFGPGEEQIAWKLLNELDNFYFDQSRWATVAAEIGKRTKKNRPDPWFEKVFAAKGEVIAAWNARGDGFANTVSESAWLEFESHLETARKLLNEAWRLHPELPEAPATMITVAMGLDPDAGETEYDWFRRTVQAQIGYPDAYYSMLWALRPRWKGSHAQMAAFGEECLATGRYDRGIPLFYLTALRDIAAEMPQGQWLLVFRIPGVYEKLMTMFQGMIDEPTRAGEQDIFKAQRVVVAMWCGHYAEAAAWWPEVKADVNFNTHYWGKPLSRNGVGRDAIEGELRAFSGAQKTVMLEGEQAELQGDLEGALRCYRQVLAASQNDPLVRIHLSDRIGTLWLLQIEPRAIERPDLPPLLIAVILSHLDVAQFLLENGANPNVYDENDLTPLNYAVSRGNEGLTRQLIECGANVVDQRWDGWNALDVARSKGNPAIIQLVEQAMPK